MEKKHDYRTSVTWTGNMGPGTTGYRDYKRSHTIGVHGKADIFCSSDPAFMGDRTKHNPEELLVASLSSCHMLWYLHLCSQAGVIVMEYSDQATGIMAEAADGSGLFTEVTLHPLVIVRGSSMVAKAMELHDEAHALCFVANSVNFPVRHKASCHVSGETQHSRP